MLDKSITQQGKGPEGYHLPMSDWFRLYSLLWFLLWFALTALFFFSVAQHAVYDCGCPRWHLLHGGGPLIQVSPRTPVYVYLRQQVLYI